MECKGKLAIVTGAASGMGFATACYLLEQGAKVCLIDNNKTELKIAENKINNINSKLSNNPEYLFKIADVTDETQLREVINSAESYFKQSIQIAVNCAGIAPAKKIIGKTGVMPLSDFMQVIDINLKGTFNVMRLAAENMIKNAPNSEGERGVIINTASIAAFEGQIGQVAYSASKGGVVAMTLPAAREFAAHGIRVMAIAPGLIETALLEKLSEHVRFSLQSQVPFPKRFGKPTEFASLVGEIIRNSLLNGEVIRLDAALRMV